MDVWKSSNRLLNIRKKVLEKSYIFCIHLLLIILVITLGGVWIIVVLLYRIADCYLYLLIIKPANLRDVSELIKFLINLLKSLHQN